MAGTVVSTLRLFVVERFLAERKIAIITQPPYYRISLRVILTVLYFENQPERACYSSHGGHQIECDGLTPEDYKTILPLVLPTMAGEMEQVCVCVQGPYFEGNWVSVAVCPTIKVQYDHCWNSSTAHRIATHASLAPES
jgi:hypothetical protein